MAKGHSASQFPTAWKRRVRRSEETLSRLKEKDEGKPPGTGAASSQQPASGKEASFMNKQERCVSATGKLQARPLGVALRGQRGHLRGPALASWTGRRWAGDETGPPEEPAALAGIFSRMTGCSRSHRLELCPSHHFLYGLMSAQVDISESFGQRNSVPMVSSFKETMAFPLISFSNSLWQSATWFYRSTGWKDTRRPACGWRFRQAYQEVPYSTSRAGARSEHLPRRLTGDERRRIRKSTEDSFSADCRPGRDDPQPGLWELVKQANAPF